MPKLAGTHPAALKGLLRQTVVCSLHASQVLHPSLRDRNATETLIIRYIYCKECSLRN